MRLALYQPDIPQNAGAILRLGACLGVAVDIIEPCGFLLDDRRLRRAGMDYLDLAALCRHASWDAYLDSRAREGAQGDTQGNDLGDAREDRPADRPGRLLLLTTAGATAYTEFAFAAGDTLLLGRESAGVPPEVHAAAAARLAIPMRPGRRAINVAQAAAMVLGEALRQTRQFPSGESR